MFFVFVIDYALTAIYYATYGQYYSMVCEAYLRFILSDSIQPFLDIPNILAVCVLHISNS